ncbi:MAG: 4-hydroxy-3-methylbut-2-enyl diphosphate reductase [Phycisphaerae bacterium]
MKVLLANPRGFCAGVDRAIKIVELALDVFGPPVYVRKEIVHNSHVVRSLGDRGAVFVDELDDVPEGGRAIFSAHGVAPAVFELARQRRLQVIDATCPLVTKVHLEVLRFVKQGYHVILIGHEGHDEVAGTRGHAPDHITLIENEDQARRRPIPAHDKLLVLTQTTLGVDDTRGVIDALRKRFAHLELPPTDDICYATQNRQDAVKAMAERGIDLLLGVASKNSSHAARLVEVGRARGVTGFLIDRPDDIRAEWLDGVQTIGVTAGASTPEPIIQGVLHRLEALGADPAERFTTVEENTTFQLPAGLREAVAGRNASKPESAGQVRTDVALRVNHS